MPLESRELNRLTSEDVTFPNTLKRETRYFGVHTNASTLPPYVPHAIPAIAKFCRVEAGFPRKSRPALTRRRKSIHRFIVRPFHTPSKSGCRRAIRVIAVATWTGTTKRCSLGSTRKDKNTRNGSATDD